MKTKHAFGFGVVLSFLCATSAFAEHGVGNGGEAEVCFGKIDPETGLAEVKSAKLVDYLEALKYVPSLKGPNREDYIRQALDRLKRVDAYRVTKIEEKLKEIANKKLTYYLDRARDHLVIKKLNDATHLFESAQVGCQTVNAAVNLTKPDPSQFKYYFMQDYFDKMSPRDQAGLMLHEALYNLEADWGATTSDGVRPQIQLMSSDDITQMTAQEYYTTLKSFSKKPTVTAVNGDFGEYLNGVTFGNDPNFVICAWLLSPRTYDHVAGLDPDTSRFHIVPLEVQAPGNDVAEFSGDSNHYGIAIGFVYRGPFYTFEGLGTRSYFVQNGSGSGHFKGIRIKIDGMSQPTAEDIADRDRRFAAQKDFTGMNQVLEDFKRLENFSQPLDIQFPSMSLPDSVVFNKKENSGKVVLKSGKTFEWSSEYKDGWGIGELIRTLIFDGKDGHLKEFAATPTEWSTEVTMKDGDGQSKTEMLKATYGLTGGRTRVLRASINATGAITDIEITKRRLD